MISMLTMNDTFRTNTIADTIKTEIRNFFIRMLKAELFALGLTDSTSIKNSKAYKT